jgi:hypothetical protein
MPSFAGLASKRVEATISSGQTVEVKGLGLDVIAIVLDHIEELEKAVAGIESFSMMKLLSQAPLAVAALAAASVCGNPYSEEEQKAFLELALEDQLAVVEKIFEATMPRGFGPFAERVKALTGFDLGAAVEALKQQGAAVAVESLKAPDTSSSPQPTSSSD